MKLTFVVLHLLICSTVASAAFSSPDRYRSNRLRSSVPPQQYLELTQPLPSDNILPSCSHPVLLNHSFANTYNRPPTVVTYAPPTACPPPWNYVVLDLQVAVQGDQYDRIAGLWFGGVEVLRTSTAEPTEDGIYWSVRKDVTKYASLFARSDLDFSMMLENLVNDEFTGVYYVNVTLQFYSVDEISPAVAPSVAEGEVVDFGVSDLEMVMDRAVRGDGGAGLGSLGFGLGSGVIGDQMPADLIIPVSDDGGERGFWFRIEGAGDLHSKNVKIPVNTRRAVLEIYVSFHGNDEFWYSNPPDAYIKTNNLTTGRGNGSFREVYVAIDGKVVGSVVPIPVIFTGGINPLFWEPVVAIGAFNLPTYEIDVTPFLGLLLDGASHDFRIGVIDGISFWLVDANLHLWLDQNIFGVQAKSAAYEGPKNSIERESKFQKLDGSFEIEAKRKSKSEGWVMTWDQGNLTTRFEQKIKFKNSIKFKHNGNYKTVEQSVTTKTEVKVMNVIGDIVARASLKRKYPLNVITTTQDRGNGTSYLVTKVVHSLKETFSSGNISSSITNSQTSDGWMLVQDHNVLAGEASSNQTFVYIDNYSCYTRDIAAVNGRLIKDNTTIICPAYW
ncbi:unnamed protein product [Rhodiola kirilowii]